MTIKDLLVDKRVRATVDCGTVVRGKVYEIGLSNDYILSLIGTDCRCINTWELLSPIQYKPKPHKHRLVCADCGEDVK